MKVWLIIFTLLCFAYLDTKGQTWEEFESADDWSRMTNDLDWTSEIKKKLDINRCNLIELQSLRFLSDTQCKSILHYRELYGRFETLLELQVVPDMDSTSLQKLLPFLAIPQGDYFFDLNPRTRVEEKKLNFQNIQQSARILLSYPSHLRAGVRFSKDQFSGYLEVQNLPSNLRIIAGDYRFQWAQGLLQWSGWQGWKSIHLENNIRFAGSTRPMASWSDVGYQRGIVLEAEPIKNQRLSLTFSSGDKDKSFQQQFGAFHQIRSKKGNLYGLGIQTHMRPDHSFRVKGLSGHFQQYIKNAIWASEMVALPSGNLDYSSTLILPLALNWHAQLHIRDVSNAADNPNAKPLREGNSAEISRMAGIEHRSKFWNAGILWDVPHWNFTPHSAHDLLFQIRLKPDKIQFHEFRYHYKCMPSVENEFDNRRIDQQHHFRWISQVSPNETLRVQEIAQWMQFNSLPIAFAFTQNLRWKPLVVPLRITFSSSVFFTQYENRLYVPDVDVANRQRVYLLYGNGFRLSSQIQFKFRKKFGVSIYWCLQNSFRNQISAEQNSIELSIKTGEFLFD